METPLHERPTQRRRTRHHPVARDRRGTQCTGAREGDHATARRSSHRALALAPAARAVRGARARRSQRSISRAPGVADRDREGDRTAVREVPGTKRHKQPRRMGAGHRGGGTRCRPAPARCAADRLRRAGGVRELTHGVGRRSAHVLPDLHSGSDTHSGGAVAHAAGMLIVPFRCSTDELWSDRPSRESRREHLTVR